MATIFGSISVETPAFKVLRSLGGSCELREYPACVRAETRYDAHSPDAAMTDGLNSPFRVLAGFIFGKNEKRGAGEAGASGGGSEAVAMTAPVVMQKTPEKVAMTAPVVMQKTSEAVAMTAPVVTQQEGAGAPGGSGSGSEGTRVMYFIMPSKYHKVTDLPVPKDPRVTLVEVPAATVAAVRFKGLMNDTAAKAREAELRAAAAKEGVALSTDPHGVQFCSYNPPW